MPSAAISGVIMRSRSRYAAFQSPAVHGADVVAVVASTGLVQAQRSGLGALCALNPPLSAWIAQTGAASGSQGRSREAGARRRQPLRPDAGPVHCRQQQAPTASSVHIELALRAPRDGIGDPAVDVRLMPAAPIDADPDLRRERALGDLAVDGGAGQAGSSQEGLQADDTVWFSHGWPTCYWLFLKTTETRQDGQVPAGKGIVWLVVAWRKEGGRWMDQTPMPRPLPMPRP